MERNDGNYSLNEAKMFSNFVKVNEMLKKTLKDFDDLDTKRLF